VANDALRHAMADAKKTERDLASACRVDVKTVARWLSDEGRLPHPRHRWAASDVLGVDDTVLWPEAMRTTVKTGPDREIVAAYPFRSSCPNGVWRGLIGGADGDLIFAGYTCYFLWLEQANLRAVLRRRAESGCRVRFLLGDPDSEVTRRREEQEGVPLTISIRIKVTLDELARLQDVPGFEARFSDEHIALSLFRFDDEMLITPHLARLVGHESPMLHLRRRQRDGLFDRFAYHLAELWEAGRPVWS
jgi:transcriptional regulator with XRE-family HTH domain